MGVIFLFRDPEREDRTAAGSPIVHLRDQFRHVSCGHSRGGEFAQFDEKLLELVGASDYHSYTQDVELKKQPKGGEVSVKEGIFVVPLGFDGDAILVVIDVVRRCKGLSTVSSHFDVEAFFNPAPLKKEAVETLRDRRFIAARPLQFSSLELKSTENVEQIFPLFRKVSFQNRARMMALFNLVFIADVVRQKVLAQYVPPSLALKRQLYAGIKRLKPCRRGSNKIS